MIASNHRASLQVNWMGICECLQVAPANARRAFDRLVTAYSSPGRHYHSVEHLVEMFAIANQLAPAGSDSTAMQLAIWFHDVVYDTHAHDNEEQSAELAREIISGLRVPENLIETVARLVMAPYYTRDWEALPAPDPTNLRDADLGVLGSIPEHYLRYAIDIRLEYDWGPQAGSREGRARAPKLSRTPNHLQPCRDRSGERIRCPGDTRQGT
jgi:predicted metal-dependent HD superfamily phosphohydrolase